jgi:hypothetical protein
LRSPHDVGASILHRPTSIPFRLRPGFRCRAGGRSVGLTAPGRGGVAESFCSKLWVSSSSGHPALGKRSVCPPASPASPRFRPPVSRCPPVTPVNCFALLHRLLLRCMLMRGKLEMKRFARLEGVTCDVDCSINLPGDLNWSTHDSVGAC